ncbi:chaplin family protein [Streptomyces sp. NPDC023327]|uniref:chaplin family protein n=1 Tax=Streptomyces sp. NPDC023327 TaxID=3157088 RepID=UPI00340106A8
MIPKRTAAATILLTTAATGVGVVTAAPASAGGVGDFLSPAFGTSCSNLNNGAHAAGGTTHGTGSADGNLVGLPIGSPFNQCGGADLAPSLEELGLAGEASQAKLLTDSSIADGLG